VNCGAIPESLLESELFGHERGAFTGAVRAHSGLFEQAHTGTLLLDEIGEMPIALQTRLLRVLEASTVRRIGGQKDRNIDVRVVAATSRDLPAMVAGGTFREDLLYRLKVVHIAVPALRDRVEDIPMLVDALLVRASERLGCHPVGVSHEAMHVLLAHDWPGNVRELENALERALLMAGGAEIEVQDLPFDRAKNADDLIDITAGDDLSIKRHTSALERLLIRRALVATDGNRSQAARLLDISYKALVYKIRGYGLEDE
jgi:two-component system response regulator AtoC